jgi:ABC-type molybdate transport system substrate-binding protein
VARLLLLTVGLGVGATVVAAELRVYCPSALREPMLEAARAYARSTDHRVQFVFASLGALQKRVAMGERADVVIGSAQGVEALVRLGMAREESRVEIATTILAFAVRRGTPLPSIADAQEMRGAVESAAAVGVPDEARGAPGAAQVNQLLQALQLSAEVRSRLRRLGGGAEAVKLLHQGVIDLALLWMSDVAGVAGIETSAPILIVPTQGVTYAAAVPRSAPEPELGRSFIAHLRSTDSAQAFARAGYRAADCSGGPRLSEESSRCPSVPLPASR